MTNQFKPIKFIIELMTKVHINIIISGGVIVVMLNHLSHVVPANSQSQHSKESAQAQLHSFNRTQYEQLEIGMTLTDVRAILNPGVEISRSATTSTFVWENPDGSKITANFENDKLKSKQQTKLK